MGLNSKAFTIVDGKSYTAGIETMEKLQDKEILIDGGSQL